MRVMQSGADNTGGDDATGYATSCIAILRTRGCTLVSHVKQEPSTTPAMTRQATMHHATVACKEDEHVAGHKCLPCPENESNNAGNLATGKNTTCIRLTSSSSLLRHSTGHDHIEYFFELSK